MKHVTIQRGDLIPEARHKPLDEVYWDDVFQEEVREMMVFAETVTIRDDDTEFVMKDRNGGRRFT